MKAKYFLAMLILAVGLMAWANAGKLSENEKVSKEVYDSIKKGENVKVFISLKEDIREAKEVYSGNYERISYIDEEKIMRYRNKNIISAEINDGELKELTKDKRVVSVKSVGIRKVFLQDSVPLINATGSWNLQVNGLNLTGIGQTICIIDTGVNYSHTNLGGCYGNNNASSPCKVVGGYDYVNDDTNPYDDHGHGTHVSGIVAANGTLNGVAPGAKIVMLKACDSAGDCSDSNIASSIDWCVGNKSTFNISVIGMSLGSGSYSDYCNDDPLSVYIWDAVNNNISVVIASGNNGTSSRISAPACVVNATPVSATDKGDNIASYSSRNSLVNLFAPGTAINSTSKSGGFESRDGTSMAAPHVAGAIAIAREFLSLTGQTKSPKQIEAVFNNTGKRITDSATGLNYSRINVYDALNRFSFNYTNLTSPSSSKYTNLNQSFTCNSSAYLNLTNITFYIWNSSGFEYSNYSNVGGLNNGSVFSYNFSREGTYNWNCLAKNSLGFGLMANTNYSVVYDLTPPGIGVLVPLNNSWHSAGRFNASLNEAGTCWYSLNMGVLNYTLSANLSNSGFNATNLTLLQGARYNVTFYCNDTTGNRNSSRLIFFSIDFSAPNVSLVGPIEGYSATGTTNVLFEYNVSDNLNITKCELNVGNSVSMNSSAIGNGTNNISYSLGAGSYSWNMNCTDEAGNIGNSSYRSLTINSPPASASSGGGGGGGGAPTTTAKKYTPAYEEIASGVTKELAKGDKVEFSESADASSPKHTLTIDSVGDNSVNITIKSELINIELIVGESKKFNLTSSEYYDLFVKLEGIVNKTANITIRAINEKIAGIGGILESNETIQEENKDDSLLENDGQGWEFLILGGVILVIIFIVFILGGRKGKIKRKTGGWKRR